MKMIKNNFLIILLSVLVLASCQNDSIRPNVPIGLYENGYFVTNEGNFGTGNGSLSFIDDRGSVSNNIFAQTNSFSLGDVVQSMEIINGKAFIVVNNSSKIEVANIITSNEFSIFKGSIQGLRPMCRNHASNYSSSSDVFAADDCWCCKQH